MCINYLIESLCLTTTARNKYGTISEHVHRARVSFCTYSIHPSDHDYLGTNLGHQVRSPPHPFKAPPEVRAGTWLALGPVDLPPRR